MQGDISEPILFNVFFDFIIRKVLEEADIEGIKLAYGSNDFYHPDKQNYTLYEILVLISDVNMQFIGGFGKIYHGV